MAHLDKFPELEPILAKMAEGFVNDEPDDPEGRLMLLCSLIVMVEGEFARTGIARSTCLLATAGIYSPRINHRTCDGCRWRSAIRHPQMGVF